MRFEYFPFVRFVAVAYVAWGWCGCMAYAAEPADTVCGARCVLMVMQCQSHSSDRPNLTVLIDELHDRNGVLQPASCHDLCATLQRHGVDWRTFYIRTAAIGEIQPLSIVHTGSTRNGHFQLMVAVDDGHVTLWDGLRGLLTIKTGMFEKEFSGYVIAPAGLEKTNQFRKHVEGGLWGSFFVFSVFGCRVCLQAVKEFRGEANVTK